MQLFEVIIPFLIATILMILIRNKERKKDAREKQSEDRLKTLINQNEKIISLLTQLNENERKHHNN